MRGAVWRRLEAWAGCGGELGGGAAAWRVVAVGIQTNWIGEPFSIKLQRRKGLGRPCVCWIAEGALWFSVEGGWQGSLAATQGRLGWPREVQVDSEAIEGPRPEIMRVS